MIYFNFVKVDYLGKTGYYSVPAVRIPKTFSTENMSLTEAEFEEYFIDYPLITIGQIIPSFQGLTFKQSKEVTDGFFKYALKQNSTFKTKDGPRTILTSSPSSEYDFKPAFEMQPHFPQSSMTLINQTLPDVGNVACILEYKPSAITGPFSRFTKGRNSEVYIGIVKFDNGLSVVDYVSLFVKSPEHSGYTSYTGDILPDVSTYPKYGEPTDDSPYQPGDYSGPAGGGGNFGTDRESEDLTPLIPNGSAENDLVDAGIFTRYLVNNAQLKEFAKWLFVDNWGEAIWRELTISTFGNIYDSLISVMSYPFAVGQLPGITTVSGNIYLGSLNSGAHSSGILAKSFSQIDWGSISITEYWGNFLDYAPHTKIQLFLPWGTGFVDIDPNEVMNGTLQVKTNIELSKGTCVHIVYTGEGAIIGTYNGFCGAQYPITAVDTSGKAIAAAVSAVGLATAVGAGALAKAAGAAGLEAAQSGYAETAAQMFHKESGYNALSSKSAKTAAESSLAAARIPPSFVRNGAFAPNAAGMMPQKPFIVMTWPDQSVPEQYGSHVGYPSNIYISLGRLRGYTEVGAIHLDGINCTEHEREELMSLLQGGVIL